MATQIRTFRLPASGTVITYELERKSVKRLNLRVRPDGSMHISIPRRETITHVEQFLAEREAWILRAAATVKSRADRYPKGEALGYSDSLHLLGVPHALRFVRGKSAPRVTAPENPGEPPTITFSVADPADPTLRQAAIEAFEKAETTRLVTALVQKYHPCVAVRGVPYPAHIRFKRMTSRFGSCAPGTMSLNFCTRLCEYPIPFIEYVVVHELCHFLVPNHSPAFYAEVAQILPDWRARERLGKAAR